MTIKMKIAFLGGMFFAVPFFANAAPHSAGTNIVSNGTVFMITTEGQRRPYTSAGAFLSYGFNSWDNVVETNADDLALPIGSFIPPRDGQVVCSDRGNDKGTCYLISNGKRAGFVSEKIFKALGFNFKKTLPGDVSFLERDSNISNEGEAHRSGVLINKSGTIYVVGDNGLYGVPDMDTLKSWGYSVNDAITANNQDKQLTQARVISRRIAGQISPQNTANQSPSQTLNPQQPSVTAPTLQQLTNLRRFCLSDSYINSVCKDTAFMPGYNSNLIFRAGIDGLIVKYNAIISEQQKQKNAAEIRTIDCLMAPIPEEDKLLDPATQMYSRQIRCGTVTAADRTNYQTARLRYSVDELNYRLSTKTSFPSLLLDPIPTPGINSTPNWQIRWDGFGGGSVSNSLGNSYQFHCSFNTCTSY